MGEMIEEHDMLNWLKANRKVMNAGKINRCVPYGMMSYRNGSSPLLMYVEY